MSTLADQVPFDAQPRTLNDVIRVIQALGEGTLLLVPAPPPAGDHITYVLTVLDGVWTWVDKTTL